MTARKLDLLMVGATASMMLAVPMPAQEADSTAILETSTPEDDKRWPSIAFQALIELELMGAQGRDILRRFTLEDTSRTRRPGSTSTIWALL